MRLSNGEKLMVARRRKGESQARVAERLGVTQALYSMWENDKSPINDRVQIPRINPSASEKCFLERRRANLTQIRVSTLLGVPLLAVIACERGEPLPALSAKKYSAFLRTLDEGV